MNRRRSGRRSQKRLGAEYLSAAQRVDLSLVATAGDWWTYVCRLPSALLLIALAWASYILFTSPDFYVYGAEVRGNSAVTPEEVYAASGLEGLSIFWVDPATISERVQTLPNIKSAHVRVLLPARVIISIEERTPELIWQTGDAQWWVDAQGTLVPPRGVLSDTLTIIDTDARPVSAGDTLDTSISQAAQSLRRLLPGLRVIHYSRATGISFKTGEGWPVFLGDGQNIDAKLTILLALYKDLLARGVSPEFIDVRFVERPYYK